MRVNFKTTKITNNKSLLKVKKSILKHKNSSNLLSVSQIPFSRNETNSSNRFSFIRNSCKTLSMNRKSIKHINPNGLVYESPYIATRNKDFNGLCNDLKILEKSNRLFFQSNNNDYNLDGEDFDFANIGNSLKLNDANPDYNNIEDILNIVEKVKIPPENRNLGDLLEIVKYLTTTKLGKYFKEGFEQKEIFEKLITFCGVEMRYKFFKKGETIFRIGDLPDNFYMILCGKVDILKPLSKNTLLTGHQYFEYLMELKKSKDDHLFNLCINANNIHFKIDGEDARDLKYIYLYIVLEHINRHKIVDFSEELNLVNMSSKDFDLDPKKIGDIKYISDNIKKIKIYLPDIPSTTISKYLFFKENSIQKEVTVYNYSSFLTLDTKSYFGDSAMDSNTTRNATVAAAEDTHTAYISCNSYFHHVVVEKAALIDKKVQFLNSNFIFSKIGQKKFEKKYFGLFICNSYKKGDIIYREGDLPLNVYFIEQGDVEIYTSKNIFELQNVIEYLEQKRKNFKKKNKEDESKEKEYIFTYGKVNFQDHDIRKDIIRKSKNTIFLLKENEDLGLLSFYFGYPYFATSIVSSATARIYQIDNKYLSDMILKEKILYNDLINRVEHKLSLFHERFFNINNTKLLLADHQKLLESKGKKNNPNIDSYNCKINNKNINLSQENHSHNKKNDFNKTVLKINYGRLKQIFERIQKTKINLNNQLNVFNQQKTKSRISNYLEKMNLPFINTQKSIKIGENNSTDKTLTIKLKTMKLNNDEVNTSAKGSKFRNKNVLIKRNIFKNTSVKRVISIKKNKNNDNLSNIIFRNKSCTFLEEQKFCIDPVLKESYENYEKVKADKYKRIKLRGGDQNDTEERNKNRNLSVNHKHSFECKRKNKQNLYKNIPFYNNINNSLGCKSKSFSTNNMKDKNKNIDDYNYQKNDALTKKIHHIKINHPYVSPLVLRKKEQYEIFNAEKPLIEDKTEIKKFQKTIQRKKDFNQLGFYFKFIKKYNKNYPFKN